MSRTQPLNHQAEVDKLEEQITRVAQSTRTSLPFLVPLHNWLRLRFPWYYNWHLSDNATALNLLILIILVLIIGSVVVTALGTGIISTLIVGWFYFNR